MSSLKKLIDGLEPEGDRLALVSPLGSVSYRCLRKKVSQAEDLLRSLGCVGSTVILLGDYSPDSISGLLALWNLGNVVSLCCSGSKQQMEERIAVAKPAWIVTSRPDQGLTVARSGMQSDCALINALIDNGQPGFIIFSSGSTGKPKASVHCMQAMLDKHSIPKRPLNAISFLLFDHIGGLNTLLHVLFNRGTLVIPETRSPDAVALAIETHRVQALTTSPTFLNLLVISGALDRHSLRSLEVVNYGTEPMPESLLATLNQKMPWVRFIQAYGLTETGIIPVRSVSSSSTWVTFDESKCDVRVVNGLLEVRTTGSMLGYVNAPSPFTEDGYFQTGDAVAVDGGRYRVLGRASDLINVGGEKAYPAEIENVLREMPGVIEVAVAKFESPLVGQMIGATFRLKDDEAPDQFRRRMYEYCKDRLPSSHVPRRVNLTTAVLHNDRFKRLGSKVLNSVYSIERDGNEH